MKIKITKKHIENGKKKCNKSCPIALAMNEQTGKSCIVDTTKTYIGKEWFWTTKEMFNFIDLFDRGYTVKPTTLIINWEAN